MIRPSLRSLALCLALLAGGCSRGPAVSGGAQSGADQPANVQLVTDIPMPSGASLDNDRTLILSDRDRWTGRVVMALSHSAGDMTAFYQAQMPNYGWQPMMSVTADISILTYVRGDRAATVQIERRAFYGCVVSVTVAPKQSDATTQGGGGYDSAPAPRSAPAGGVRSEPLAPPQRR